MKDYSHYYPSRDERLRHKAEENFRVHYDNGDESALVTVNDSYKRQVIVKEHSNPINEYLEDLKMYYIDDERKPIRWGDELSGYDDTDGHKYLVVTRPSSNGITSKCKIRKMYNTITFDLDENKLIYDCIMAKGLLYNVTSYVKETEVFQDEDMIAILVRYDDNTKKLKMFDTILLDNEEIYKIVKIDDYTLKERLESFGILQIVLLKTVFGELTGNRFNEEPFDITGILRYSKLKERVLNAKAREILTPHNILHSGDYIIHKFPRTLDPTNDVPEETRTYIVRSLIDMRNEYDSAYILNCTAEFNLKMDNGDALLIPAYFEDNASQLMANERNSNVFNENSKLKCIVQANKYTNRLGKEISRVLIHGDAYEVVGIDKLTAEGVIGVEFVETKINPRYDNLEMQIADYYKNDSVEDTTSDLDFETLYKDPSEWTYLNGSNEFLLGESMIYDVSFESKIIHNEDPILIPYKIEFILTDENGNKIENGSQFECYTTGNSFHVKTAIDHRLLGTKLTLKSITYFEEQQYISDETITKCHVSEHTKEINVSGW